MRSDAQSRVLHEQVDQLYTHIPVGLIANVVNAAILVSVLSGQVSRRALTLWAGGVGLLILVRIVLICAYRKARPGPDRAALWGKLFTIAIGFSGVVWGAAGAFLFPVESIPHQAFLAFVLGGMVSGAAAAFSALRRAFYVYTIPALLPLMARFVLLGDEIHLAMGGMISLFAVLMLATALRVNRTLIQSFRLRHENVDLIKMLRSEVEVRKKAEEDLRRHEEELEATVQDRTETLVMTNRHLEEEIKERVSAEKALRESEEKFRQISEQSLMAITIVQDGRFAYANEALATLVSQPLADVMEWGPDEVTRMVHPEDRREHPDCLSQVGGGIRHHSFRVVTLAGEARWVDMYSRPITYRERAARLCTMVDISERVRAEEERSRMGARIQQSQKLEGLAVLAGGIAHDFNNLLTSILGNVELSILALGEDSPALPLQENIRVAGRRAAELSQQMLTYSGKRSLLLKPVRLTDIVLEMTRLLDVSIPKSVRLELHLAEGLPVVEADPTQLRQVVMNLITNGAEALGGEAGTITIRTAVEHHEAGARFFLDEQLAGGRYVVLEVADTGVGMDEETQKRIFDPFFTTKFTGRGLGLAAVLGIVRGHNGAIRADSEPGRGTTFRVLLPALEGETPPEPVDASGVPRYRGSGVVLVVDDERAVRDVAKFMLEKLGFEVLLAEDGIEAIEVYREHADEIRLVLLDLTMPRMSGEETIPELKKIRSDVRIVLFSGYAEAKVADRFEGIGLKGFIQKPVELRTLAAALRSALESGEPDSRG